MSNEENYKIISAERLPEALARYEKVIEDSFVKAGQAFKTIKVFKLWEDNIYTNFEHYCRKRWGYSRIHVFRLIQASDIALDLLPIGNNLSEGVVRELVPLPTSESRKEVMEEVFRQNPKPTALDVRKGVEKKLVELLPATDQRVQKIKKQSDRSIKVAEKRFSKLWIEFRNTYSDIPMWELDEMAIKVIQNH